MRPDGRRPVFWTPESMQKGITKAAPEAASYLYRGACTEVPARMCPHCYVCMDWSQGGICTEVLARRGLHGRPPRRSLHGEACTEGPARQFLHGKGCTEVPSRRAQPPKRRKTAPRPQAGNGGTVYFFKKKRRSPNLARDSCKKRTNGERGKDKEYQSLI